MSNFGYSVMDFGAVGDGVTDDTAAIQAAIDFAAARGGGKILFPYTKGGYRIASSAVEEVDGKPVRAQLVIPAGDANIQLEGEMPCRMLTDYVIRSPEYIKHHFIPTTFGTLKTTIRDFSPIGMLPRSMILRRVRGRFWRRPKETLPRDASV